jgi:hypothetical protein
MHKPSTVTLCFREFLITPCLGPGEGKLRFLVQHEERWKVLPDVPTARACQHTHDKALLALAGDEIAQIVARIARTPPEVVARYNAILHAK